MTVKEIASKLVEYCRKAEWEKAQQELYADDAVSTEPYETPDFAKVTKGKKAIMEKGEKFTNMTVEMHSVEISEPLLAENSFVFRLEMDITTKGRGRMKMQELCVYEVKDGKIVSEQFFI
jgi:hypothetical protein